MERLHCILHSHGSSLRVMSLSALPKRRALTNLVGDWLGLRSGSPLCLDDDSSAENLAFPFDGDYQASIDLQPNAESHLDRVFDPEEISFISPEPVVGSWDSIFDDFNPTSEPLSERGCPLDQVYVRENHQFFIDFFLSLSHSRPVGQSFRSIAVGCAVHLAALSLFIAVPTPSLRGHGGISDKPVSVRLMVTSEIKPPENPSPPSVHSPASLATRARRDPKPEQVQIRKATEKELPKEVRLTEVTEQTNAEPRLADAKPIAKAPVSVHQRVPLEHTQEGPSLDSKNLHDSIASTPSIASPEQKSHLKAGDQEQTYKDLILSAIHEAAYYPRTALSHMVHGKAMVSFTINKDGSLENVVIATPANSKVLNEAAVKIVEKASSHFPPVPDSLAKEQVSYVVPIVFKQKR